MAQGLFGTRSPGIFCFVMVALGVAVSAYSQTADDPSTLTLEAARDGLALASGSARDFLDLAALVGAFGDKGTARRFEQYARARAAEVDGATTNDGNVTGEGYAAGEDGDGQTVTAQTRVGGDETRLVDEALAPRPRRPVIDYQGLVAARRARGKDVPEPTGGRSVAAPEAWIEIILRDMTAIGMENEAIRFALKNRALAPATFDPHLKTLRAAWAARLDAYAPAHPSSELSATTNISDRP